MKAHARTRGKEGGHEHARRRRAPDDEKERREIGGGRRRPAKLSEEPDRHQREEEARQRPRHGGERHPPHEAIERGGDQDGGPAPRRGEPVPGEAGAAGNAGHPHRSHAVEREAKPFAESDREMSRFVYAENEDRGRDEDGQPREHAAEPVGVDVEGIVRRSGQASHPEAGPDRGEHEAAETEMRDPGAVRVGKSAQVGPLIEDTHARVWRRGPPHLNWPRTTRPDPAHGRVP